MWLEINTTSTDGQISAGSTLKKKQEQIQRVQETLNYNAAHSEVEFYNCFC